MVTDQQTELSYIRFSLEQLLHSGQAALQHLDNVQGVVTITAGTNGRKRRGRKPKTTALISADAQMGTPTDVPKRRGRPPKAASGNGRRRGRKTQAEQIVEKVGAPAGRPVAQPSS